MRKLPLGALLLLLLVHVCAPHERLLGSGMAQTGVSLAQVMVRAEQLSAKAKHGSTMQSIKKELAKL